MNCFTGIGRLGRDPEGKVVTYDEGKKEIDKAEFSIALTSGYGAKQTITWVNCECFGALARNVCKYMHKGDMIGIKGRLQINKFENKQGQKVTMTKIVVEEQMFLPKQAGKTSNPEDEYLPEKEAEVPEVPEAPQVTPDDGFVDVPDGIEEDLPFR